MDYDTLCLAVAVVIGSCTADWCLNRNICMCAMGRMGGGITTTLVSILTFMISVL